MDKKEREIITYSKDINDIKERIFKVYPELRKYSNACFLEREFGKNEECGTNKMVFKNHSKRNIEVIIVYIKS